MPPFLPVVALSRSQNIRIGNAMLGAIGSHTVSELAHTVAGITSVPYYVDLGDSDSRRDFQHHAALGAIVPVGAITPWSSDYAVTSGLSVTSGTGLTVNISSGVLTQLEDGTATISTLSKTGLSTPAPPAASTDFTYLIAVNVLPGADQGTIVAVPGAAAGSGTSVAPAYIANTVPLATVVVSNGGSNVGTITSIAPSAATTLTSVTTTGNVSVGGTLSVTGASSHTGNATFAGTVGVTGASTFTGAASFAGHVGFNGATAVGKSSAYTLTYSTAARTVPNATYGAPTKTATSVVTTGSTSTSPFGYTQAQADAIVTQINDLSVDLAATNTSLAALAADVLALKKIEVALVTDLEAVGIAG